MLRRSFLGDPLRFDEVLAKNVHSMPIGEQPCLANPIKLCAVNRASMEMSNGDERAAERTAHAAPMVADAQGFTGTARCVHCGERCVGSVVSEEGHHFCCLGCRAVYSLLTESGLGQFYELAPSPGSRVGEVPLTQQWAFLDEPTVRDKLLDFADERHAKVTLYLPAIHCVACVWLLENLFRLHGGVGESRVNFARREVGISFDPTRAKLSEIAGLLTSLGYEPKLTFGTLDQAAARRTPPWRQREWLQVGVAGFGFGNTMLLALPGYLGLDSVSGPWFKVLAGWLGLALALPVLIYSASEFWRAAWLSAKQRSFRLDVPIALGLVAIYGQSVFEVASGRGEGYCDSLTGLIFFLLCGRLFKRMTFDRLAFDRDYKGFFPLAVVRQSESGEQPVPISQLNVGDQLLIRHGELVPADSRLTRGEARMDYSFVTGESEPVTRRTGEMLFAGGRQVAGSIEVETIKPVSESYLISLWDNEVFRKRRDDDFDSITNRYSRRFTMGVVGLAIAAAAFWMVVDAGMAMKAFTSVLIVACPCALALAAPLTLGTAQRWLAARNVFLRNAQVSEHIAAVDTIVFDKTGTLTMAGAGSVKWQGPPLNSDEQSWVHAVARHSAHPLSVGVVDATNRGEASAPLSYFEETPGCGLEGSIAGREIWLGSSAWLQSRAVSGLPRRTGSVGVCGDLQAGNENARSGEPARLSSGSASAVHAAIDGRYRGCFVIESLRRPGMNSLISGLQGRYQLVLLSGDNAREESSFRELLGDQARIEFNQSPFDKLQVIRELQASGRKVMMVGDGLNDAGALKQADVGVAVVEKVGTFCPASDVILDSGQLNRLAEVVGFSRRAAAVVRCGFVVSGLYNVLGVTIAAAGLLSPLICAVLMPLSSVTVVLFSIGATRWMGHRIFNDQDHQYREAANSGAVQVSLLAAAVPEEAIP